MKVYTYKPEETPRSDWPSGLLRFTGAEDVSDPDAADAIVFPPAIYHFTRDQIRGLRYMKGREAKHVFFQCSDHDTTYGLPCLFIRCNLKEKHLRDDPRSIPWPWPVEDLGAISAVPEGGWKYDISFHGWNSCHIRKDAVDACSPRLGIRYDVRMYSDFYGYIETTPEGRRRRTEFLRSVRESRLVLAPRSIDGVFPYRFWEALSAARVPVLVCSRYNLPWKDKIDWERCTIRIPEERVEETGKIVRAFLDAHNDDVIAAMGAYGRKIWLSWMNPADWPELMTRAVEEALGLGRPAP